MRIFLRNFVLFTLFVTVTACTGMPTTSGSAKEMTQVKQVLMKYENAVNTGNVDDLISLYSETAMQIAPNEPVIKGWSAIRERAEANHAFYTYQLSSNIDETRIKQDSATIVASYSENFTNRNDSSDTTETSGSWLLLLEKQTDGAWKIMTEIWHHDRPVNIM